MYSPRPIFAPIAASALFPGTIRFPLIFGLFGIMRFLETAKKGLLY